MEIHIHIHNGMMPEMDDEMEEKLMEDEEEDTEPTGLLGEIWNEILGKAKQKYTVEYV